QQPAPQIAAEGLEAMPLGPHGRGVAHLGPQRFDARRMRPRRRHGNPLDRRRLRLARIEACGHAALDFIAQALEPLMLGARRTRTFRHWIDHVVGFVLDGERSLTTAKQNSLTTNRLGRWPPHSRPEHAPIPGSGYSPWRHWHGPSPQPGETR